MKTLQLLTLATILSSNLLYSADELSWVDEQIKAIKPPRHGIQESVINKLKPPFIFFKKDDNKTKQEDVVPSVTVPVTNHYHTKTKTRHYRGLTLRAIMNKSALIGGKWYKEGSKVHGYTLRHVGRKSVILVRKHKKITLSIKTKRKNLKFSK